MFIAFVVGLVLMEIFASSSIATAAHIGGLLSGLLMGSFLRFTIAFFEKNLLGRPITAGKRS